MGFGLIVQIMELERKIARLEGILREINATCYIPSKGRHAYTHFQADFDKIRALTDEWYQPKEPRDDGNP